MINFSPRRLSDLAKTLVKSGSLVPSERGPTIELQNMLLVIDDPRDRIATQPWRKMNIGFAITDALSHIVGDNKLEPLTQFVPKFAEFSGNGKTIDGSYGVRIHTCNQLDEIIALLIKNPQTRRAVLTIYMGPTDLLGGGGTNTPCTLNLNFLVRNGRLDMTAMMRSNDIILGLTNDVFTFTMLHEYVAMKTSIPLGRYFHFATSFHMYAKDIEMDFSNPKDEDYIWPYTMNKMPSSFDAEYVYKHLSNLSRMDVEDCMDIHFYSSYEKDLFLASASVQKRHEVGVHNLYNQITDVTLMAVTRQWLSKEVRA